MTWMPPLGTFAICRMAAMVPIVLQVVRLGSSLSVGLQRQEQQPVARERAVHRLDRHRARDGERLQREREDDGVAKREDGKLGWIVALVGRHTSLQDTGGGPSRMAAIEVTPDDGI